jgi:hypothetical protein
VASPRPQKSRLATALRPPLGGAGFPSGCWPAGAATGQVVTPCAAAAVAVAVGVAVAVAVGATLALDVDAGPVLVAVVP